MSSAKISKEELANKARAVSECMLSNSWCTVAGVAIGTILGIRRKHLRPFVYAITFGTFGDLLYGYTNSCRPLINDYEAAKKHILVPQVQILVEVPPVKEENERN